MKKKSQSKICDHDVLSHISSCHKVFIQSWYGMVWYISQLFYLIKHQIFTSGDQNSYRTMC